MKNKTIIGLLLNFLLFVISFVVPKKKKTFLLGAGNGNSFKGNPKYLFLYLLGNKSGLQNVKITWITGNKNIYEDLRKNNFPVVLKQSFKGFFSVLTNQYIIIEQSAKDFSYLGTISGKFRIIQTWHGTPLKKIGLNEVKIEKTLNGKIFNYFLKKEFQKYEIVCSSSQEVSNKLKSAFLNNSIKITGYPRNDIFYNQKLFCESSTNKLDFSEYSKIISYIPTFRDNETRLQPFSSKGLINLNKYLRKNNFLFVIKKHPFDKKLADINSCSNIKDFSKEIEDVQDLLLHTDILITDYSSVFFDFLLTDKPIIYYSYDYEDYLKKCRGMYYNYYQELPGPFAKNEKELYDLISTNSWFKKKEYKKKYKLFKDKFNKFQDGNSSRRLIIEVLNLK